MAVLETERLLLRPFEPKDAPAYAAIRAKPHVVRFLPGGEARAALATQVAETVIAMFNDCWQRDGYGPWAVEEKATGRLCGHHGVRCLPEEGGVTELLYTMDDTLWGQGYATEGGRAALAYGFDTIGLDRIFAWAMPDNHASLAVMARLGFTRVPGLVQKFGLQVAENSLRHEDWTG